MYAADRGWFEFRRCAAFLAWTERLAACSTFVCVCLNGDDDDVDDGCRLESNRWRAPVSTI